MKKISTFFNPLTWLRGRLEGGEWFLIPQVDFFFIFRLFFWTSGLSLWDIDFFFYLLAHCLVSKKVSVEYCYCNITPGGTMHSNMTHYNMQAYRIKINKIIRVFDRFLMSNLVTAAEFWE